MLVITFSMVISLILVFGWIIALNRISWSSLFLCFRIMSICRLHILLLWLLLSILLLLVLFSALSILFLLLKFEHSCDLNIFDLPLLIVIIIHDMIQWLHEHPRNIIVELVVLREICNFPRIVFDHVEFLKIFFKFFIKR